MPLTAVAVIALLLAVRGKLRSSVPEFGLLYTVLKAVVVEELLLTVWGKFRYS
jgi:hypothetical protein